MKLNEPAMPTQTATKYIHGLSVREYAAIHLCVPDSGDADLDAMIRRAQRERLAEKVLCSMLSNHAITDHPSYEFGHMKDHCYQLADAFIAAGEIK
jgi:hypothetical protein